MGCSAYAEQAEVMRRTAPCAQDFTQHKASRHRRLEKNANHLFAALALFNLVMVKRQLLQT